MRKMEQEVKEGIGVIESKEEQVKASDKSKYWKFKIVMDGAQSAITFSLWDYEAGVGVSIGQKIKAFWTEKEGTNKYGVVTYRNLNSMGPTDKYEHNQQTFPTTDPNPPNVEDAPKESLKPILHKERSGSSAPTSYNQGARIGMLFNNAVNICIAENKTSIGDIESQFNSLKVLLNQLEENGKKL